MVTAINAHKSMWSLPLWVLLIQLAAILMAQAFHIFVFGSYLVYLPLFVFIPAAFVYAGAAWLIVLSVRQRYFLIPNWAIAVLILCAGGGFQIWMLATSSLNIVNSNGDLHSSWWALIVNLIVFTIIFFFSKKRWAAFI